MNKIEAIESIESYYDVKEECLYFTIYAERSKTDDFVLKNISLEKANELKDILEATGVEVFFKTSEINVKELWN